jgi:hypothetical protein
MLAIPAIKLVVVDCTVSLLRSHGVAEGLVE